MGTWAPATWEFLGVISSWMVQYPVWMRTLFYRNLPVLERIFCHGSIRNFCQSRAILCFRMEIFSLFLYSPMWGEKRKIDLFSIAKFAFPLDLTHWGRVTNICVSKLTIIGYSGLSGSEAIWRLNGLWSSMIQVIIWHLFVISHYLNQCWHIIDWALRNTFQWTFHQIIVIHYSITYWHFPQIILISS